MSRRTSTWTKMARESEKQREKAAKEAEKERVRAVKDATKAADQARKAAERARIANEKDRAKRYLESRAAQAETRSKRLETKIIQLTTLLHDALKRDSFLALESLKQTAEIPLFEPGNLTTAEAPPVLEDYLPPPLSGLRQLVPGTKRRHAEQEAAGQARHAIAVTAHNERETARLRRLVEARHAHEQQVADLRRRTAEQNNEIDAWQRQLAAGQQEAVARYFTSVLERSEYPDDFPRRVRVAYVQESKQLVVEYDFPAFDIVPEVSSFKYVKSSNEIVPLQRPSAQRRDIYASVVAQVTLRTLHELFRADRAERLNVIVFNGYVATIDQGTGRPARVCLATVRAARDIFTEFDLRKVEPTACLKRLNASLSRNPTELAPVRPVLEFNMVDPRFIEETDVLSSLDERPNLMELSPSEFEALIGNLFSRMGLETRQTQVSRDGGVDCVAYDARPILGGKVVIQAKRYKHTVGVSAVRDLFGTLQNEGASKGILVTTSGYGKASFEFAQGKPIELLSGSNLLHLLAEHAGIQAKIVAPDDWRDPAPDSMEG